MYRGKSKAAITLDRETIFVKTIIIKKVPREAKPTFQDSAIKIPKPVATALPPLQFNHIGQICPATANNPARTSKILFAKKIRATFTAIKPLRTSIKNTQIAGHFPTFLKTFVAPVEPDPIDLKSIFFNFLAKRNPVGKEPNR